MSSHEESDVYRLLAELSVSLDAVRDADKALKTALRMTREHFEADAACIAWLPRGQRRAELRLSQPQHAPWNVKLVAEFLRGGRPRLPEKLLLAPLERRGRKWAALGLKRRKPPFDRDELRDVVRVADAISKAVQRIDRLRLAEVRARIDRKIMEQLRPKDLFYQILHGLRTLTRYDHSAAVLFNDEERGLFVLEAEQIAWRKGKSKRVGDTLPATAEALSLMEAGGSYGFDREGGHWREWSGRKHAELLADALDYNRGADVPEGERGEMCMLCAPLSTRDGVLGVLKIASSHPKSLGAFEAELVDRFLPQAAIAIRNLRRAESLEVGMLAAEKKLAVANLARGVSHDVNNAVGAVLPLVQQMSAEARDGRLKPEDLVQDLEQIEESLLVCRRIFGGMLSLAKGAAGRVGDGNVRRAVESTLAILDESLRRHGVEALVEVEGDLPLARASQGDLEQLLLNLVTNARDSMGEGGRLRVRAVANGRDVEVRIDDTGEGIDPELRARIHEPFFTTKRQGSGLGLSICRSIVWNAKGRMTIASELGEGTRVKVVIPAAEAAGSKGEEA